MNRKFTLVSALLIALYAGVNAQDATKSGADGAAIPAQPSTEEPKKFEPTIGLKGFSQLNFAYGENEAMMENDNAPMGFNVRRLRVMPYGDLSEKASWGIMINADNYVMGITTAYFNYKLAGDVFQVKAGMIDNSGALYGSGSSSSNLVLVQHPQVVQEWAGKFLTNGYYDLGVKLHGKTKLFNYGVMFANADGKNHFPGIGLTNRTYTHENNGVKGIGRLGATPVKGLDIGAFGGMAQYRKTSFADTVFVTFSAGVDGRYDAHNIYAHFGYIMGEYDEAKEYAKDAKGAALNKKVTTAYNGFYVHAGYKIKYVMPTVGFDMFTPNTDADPMEAYTNITVGCDVHFNKNLKIQANYILRQEKEKSIDNNLIMLNLQYIFDKKNL